eukprot:Lankesteria_metandrocarpae@DN1269_c0_g1_i1.p1
MQTRLMMRLLFCVAVASWQPIGVRAGGAYSRAATPAAATLPGVDIAAYRMVLCRWYNNQRVCGQWYVGNYSVTAENLELSKDTQHMCSGEKFVYKDQTYKAREHTRKAIERLWPTKARVTHEGLEMQRAIHDVERREGFVPFKYGADKTYVVDYLHNKHFSCDQQFRQLDVGLDLNDYVTSNSITCSGCRDRDAKRKVFEKLYQQKPISIVFYKTSTGTYGVRWTYHGQYNYLRQLDGSALQYIYTKLKPIAGSVNLEKALRTELYDELHVHVEDIVRALDEAGSTLTELQA